MARQLNSFVHVKPLALAAIVVLFASCRGEPVPRDYQNQPPAMTHPATSSTQTPTAHGMGSARPEPTTGVEGTAGPYKPTTPTGTTATTGDSRPVTTTT
jgi:hypothetical protein